MENQVDWKFTCCCYRLTCTCNIMQFIYYVYDFLLSALNWINCFHESNFSSWLHNLWRHFKLESLSTWYFRVNETQWPRCTIGKVEEIKVDNSSPKTEDCDWGTYARGALYALSSRGNHLAQVIVISQYVHTREKLFKLVPTEKENEISVYSKLSNIF